MDVLEVLGYVGAVFNVATYSMRTMIPLRIFAIVSNSIFITYAGFAGVYPVLILHSVLLPLNGYRLHQMLRLVANIRSAVSGDLKMDWLKPFMTKRRYAAGDTLFQQGDEATEMFLTLSGRFRIRDLGLDIGVGQLVGELGLFAPENRRSQTIDCVEDGDVLTITYDQVRELYFQNPEFGFYFLRLTTGRLFQNLARLEAEVQTLRSAQVAGAPEPAKLPVPVPAPA